MDVVSTCPLRVASIVWQPRPGAWVLTVVCKATYVLQPGVSPLAKEQDEPSDADKHWNDDGRRSLHVASDMAPFKRRADVQLVGDAYAPERRPTLSLRVRLAVGLVNKAIDVYGDRAWTLSGELRERGPFVKMPLVWERAAGGPGTSNPVGMSGTGPRDAQGLLAVPNLQSPGTRPSSPLDVITPVSFGPVAPTWPGRVEKLHQYAAEWDHRAWITRPLPGDIDGSYFNAAPPDQQLDELRSDARIELGNLSPDHALLVTQLLGVTPRLTVDRGRAGEEVRLRCDTLWINTHRGIAALTWRGQVLIAHPAEAGRVVVSAVVAAPNPQVDFGERTFVVPLAGGTGQVLPFREGESALAKTGASSAMGALEGAPVLPRWAQRDGADDGTGTILGALTGPAEVLPFQKRGAGIIPPAPELLVVPPAPSAMPPEPTSPPPLASAAGPEKEEIEPPTVLGWKEERLPAPPPMIGPLAKVKSEASPAPPAMPPKPASPPPTFVEAPGVASSSPPEPEQESVAEPVDLTIEQAAAIAAEIAEERATRAEILRAHGLEERAWAKVERQWSKAIEEEAARGSGKLQAASDAAYVAAVEGFRGLITLDEYAELVVGLERRRADRVLDELKIQRPALMRIVRLWTKKVSKDMKLADAADRALRTARRK